MSAPRWNRVHSIIFFRFPRAMRLSIMTRWLPRQSFQHRPKARSNLMATGSLSLNILEAFMKIPMSGCVRRSGRVGGQTAKLANMVHPYKSRSSDKSNVRCKPSRTCFDCLCDGHNTTTLKHSQLAGVVPGRYRCKPDSCHMAIPNFTHVCA